VTQRQRHARHSIGYSGVIVRSRRVHQRRVAGCVEFNNANVLDRCRGHGSVRADAGPVRLRPRNRESDRSNIGKRGSRQLGSIQGPAREWCNEDVRPGFPEIYTNVQRIEP
jgi:hypothetical protein